MAKKFLDFNEDHTKDNDYVLVSNEADGTRKVLAKNLSYFTLEFSGVTDANGFVSTGLPIDFNHAFAVNIYDTFTGLIYNDAGNQNYSVKVLDINLKPKANTSVHGWIYYVKN